MCNAATVIKILFTFSGDVIDCPVFLTERYSVFPGGSSISVYPMDADC